MSGRIVFYDQLCSYVPVCCNIQTVQFIYFHASLFYSTNTNMTLKLLRHKIGYSFEQNFHVDKRIQTERPHLLTGLRQMAGR
jgi:hypothetical protein